jgi:hypothetical protein
VTAPDTLLSSETPRLSEFQSATIQDYQDQADIHN